MRLRDLLVDISPLKESSAFRRVFAARVASLVGAGLVSVTVAVQVYDITKSSLGVGLVELVFGVFLMCGFLVGGVIADRYDRKKVLVTSGAASTLVFVAMAVNALPFAGSLPIIFVAAAIAGTVIGIEGTALTAVTPAVVKDEHLAAAGALTAIAAEAGFIGGPTLAGFVITVWGTASAYAMTAACVGASTVLLVFLPALVPAGEPEESPIRSIRTGFAFVVRTPIVRSVLLIDICTTLFVMPMVLFPELADEFFGGGAQTVGLLYSAPAVGALIGSSLSGWTGRIAATGQALILVVIGWGVMVVGFGLSPNLWVAMAFLAGMGFLDAYSEILRRALIQHYTPDELQARVSSLWLATATAWPSMGDVVTGVASRLVGPTVALVGGGLASIGSATASPVLLPGLRKATLSGPSADAARAAVKVG